MAEEEFEGSAEGKQLRLRQQQLSAQHQKEFMAETEVLSSLAIVSCRFICPCARFLALRAPGESFGVAIRPSLDTVSHRYWSSGGRL